MYQPSAKFLRTQMLQPGRFNHRERWSLAPRNFAALSWPSTMRRAQAILVIVAMLATPLALLARGVSSEASECSSMCCLSHGHHAAQHKAMECDHGATGHVFECSMTSSRHTAYGLIAPIVPTVPSAVAFLAIPDNGREILAQFGELSAAGLVSVLFQPPRI
jgi:hypothetical protein